MRTPLRGLFRPAQTERPAWWPLARVIQEHIKKPLADDILFGRLVRGGHVKIILKDSKIDFEIESTPEKPAKGSAATETEAEPALVE